MTVWDLNQPAAHLFAFRLALICEAEIAGVLRKHLGEQPDQTLERVEKMLGKGNREVRRWKKARDENSQIHLASSLTFGDKPRLLPNCGREELAAQLMVSSGWLSAELAEIGELRNALAHYDEGNRLAKADWVHDTMRRTHYLARLLAER